MFWVLVTMLMFWMLVLRMNPTSAPFGFRLIGIMRMIMRMIVLVTFVFLFLVTVAVI